MPILVRARTRVTRSPRRFALRLPRSEPVRSQDRPGTERAIQRRFSQFVATCGELLQVDRGGIHDLTRRRPPLHGGPLILQILRTTVGICGHVEDMGHKQKFGKV